MIDTAAAVSFVHLYLYHARNWSFFAEQRQRPRLRMVDCSKGSACRSLSPLATNNGGSTETVSYPKTYDELCSRCWSSFIQSSRYRLLRIVQHHCAALSASVRSRIHAIPHSIVSSASCSYPWRQWPCRMLDNIGFLTDRCKTTSTSKIFCSQK